jgi:hypothetical protein
MISDSFHKKQYTGMATLSECLEISLDRGYTENFGVIDSGLTTDDEKSVYTPEDIMITNFYRFEGNSNPDDNSILRLIETDNGKKGTLIDAYGVYADTQVSNFVRRVEDFHKRPKIVF